MLIFVIVTHRNQCIDETRELQSLLDIPFFTTAMGKSVANEELRTMEAFTLVPEHIKRSKQLSNPLIVPCG
jgi:TPP-dependent 2-oxoacid decarboxylase